MRSIVTVLPILFPVIMALVSLMIRERFSEKNFRRTYVTVTLCVNVLLMIAAVLWGSAAHLAITDELSISFTPDKLGSLLSLLFNVVWMLAGIYSFYYMEHAEERRNAFYCYYLLTIGAISGIMLAGNYMTLYMTFEAMSFMSFPMVMNSRTKESINAGMKYLFYSVAGASLGLIGYFFLNAYTTTTEFAAGGTLDLAKAAGHENLILIVTLLAIIGFGAKAGMFPLHAWLPTAHPAAPSPASAVMSGVITKCGVIAIIRVVYYLVGADFLRGTWVHKTWMILALITVFMGSMLAYKENVLKKRLAYSSVSQVSYVLFGLSTLTPVGFVGAILHVFAHCVIKTLLFMCAGSVICQTELKKVSDLRGIGKNMPVTMWCFTIASLGLVGIPPTAGFVSKWYLAQGSLASAFAGLDWAGPAVLLVSALLTAGYLFTVSITAFLPGADFDYSTVKNEEVPATMIWPMIILAAGVILMGICASPLIQFATGIAGGLV